MPNAAGRAADPLLRQISILAAVIAPMIYRLDFNWVSEFSVVL
jgi:hypothetical protein